MNKIFTHKFLSLLLIFSLYSAINYAHSDISLFKYKELSNDEFDKYIKHFSAYIIDEKTQIEILDQKPAFMVYNYIQKRTIVINSDLDFEKYTNISLPLDFDPSYKPIGSIDQNLTNMLSGIRKPEFSAKRLNKKDTSKVIITEQPQNIKSASYIMEVSQNYPFYGNYKKINYKLNNVKKNDTIQVILRYEIPYNENNYKYIFS